MLRRQIHLRGAIEGMVTKDDLPVAVLIGRGASSG